MNSAFVGYEELSGSRKGVIHLDPLNSSYPTQLHSLIANYGPAQSLFAFDVVSMQRQTRMALRELRYETKLLNFPSSLMI